MKKIIAFFLILWSLGIFAQDSLMVEQEISINKIIDGTLLLPKTNSSEHLAIIIAGSGPTDRDGNQNFMKSNSLKKLAQALTRNGIATFRYDKRTVKQIKQNKIDKNTMFDDFITDAIAVLDYFKNQGAFKDITIIGHSQGSLIGMVAAQQGADKFVSLAGAGQTIDEIITFQVGKSAPGLVESTKKTFDVLKTGETTTDFNPMLASIFNIELQPFIISWMAYNPQNELKKLHIPVLLINGTKDLQVTVDEANLLKEAYPDATLKIIENMNHIMFVIEGDEMENIKSYNESSREISLEVVNSITNFIK
ncbi:MAG: alpha/beta hydrolase [Mangrovimonas sp.]|nr:alpha/beta hydrolase [Mangrovimonas sp.]